MRWIATIHGKIYRTCQVNKIMKTIFKQTEHQIQTEIINYLRMKGWYVMRLNSGKYSVGEGKSKRFIMGQDAGTPDLMCFKKTKFGLNIEDVEGLPYVGVSLFFIEVKVSGNKPTLLQTAKMKELEEYGAKCIVATSVEDVMKL